MILQGKGNISGALAELKQALSTAKEALIDSKHTIVHDL
jgi:hypothetical protein